MKNKMILACAGLAVCGVSHGQVERGDLLEMGQKLYPVRVAEVIGLTADGMPIIGEWIDTTEYYANRNAGESSRGLSFVYDSLGVGPDTDGDGFPEPICGGPCEAGDPLVGGSARYSAAGITQRTFDDISFDAAAAGANYDGGFTGFRRGRPAGGNPCATAPEQLFLLVQLFDTADTSGTGFDSDGDGQADVPYDVNSFTGGVVLDFGVVNPTAPQWGYLGFDGLVGAGLTVALPSTDDDGNAATVEGGIELSMLQTADDLDGDGVIDVITPSTETYGVLGGTDAADTSGCRAGVSVGATGTTVIGLWAEGANVCGDPLVAVPWSEGSLSPDVDFNYDPLVDAGFFGASPTGCPDDLVWANIIIADAGGAPLVNPCGDQNFNGANDPGDFTGWVANFNGLTDNNADGILDADVNRNGANEPGDFTAWVAAFNAGLVDDSLDGDCTP
ncbi:MAG: hypothetical protein ACTS22_02415 [Phycisphaerales bacterium]